MEFTLKEDRPQQATEQLVTTLKRDIENGRLKPGQQLASIRRMAAERRLSFHTVVSAYERLAATGLISAQPGRGYFVTSRGDTQLPGSHGPSTPAPDPHGIKAFWQLFHGNEQCMKLGCGWLPPSWRDTQSLARVIRRTANFAHSSLVEYGDPAGYLPLRNNLAEHLSPRLGVTVAAEQILTTLGATQALDLVIRHLIGQDDEVLIDDPCNSNLMQLLRLRGARVTGVPRRGDGPDIDFLAAVLANRKVKAFFINSRLHNPTGTSVSPHNAFKLLQLAYEHDLTIVEDDVYGDLSAEQNNRLVTLDGLRKVIYIGSFSKTLSANLRVGYIVAPPALITGLADLKLLTCVSLPSFCERFLNEILVEGCYAKHLQAVRRNLQMSQAEAQASLRKWGWELFHPVKEGMFLWIRHPELDCLEAFIKAAFERNILLAPGSLFSADGQPTAWLRINVAHLDTALAATLFQIPRLNSAQ
jgi:DNA-binding transcriptional MocR family regulator